MKKFLKNTQGFTLVELIVVIAILGILAGVGTVGYSGYIKKANMAADQQLVAAVNQAYAVACLENGVDAANTTAADITISNKKLGTLNVIAPAAAADKIEAAFIKYFGENANAEFKMATTLNFNTTTHMFEIVQGGSAADYSSLIEILKGETTDINNVNGSTFLDEEKGLGVGNLLGKVNYVTDYALGGVADGEAYALSYKLGPDYVKTLTLALGAKAEDLEGMDEEALGIALEEQLVANGIMDAEGNIVNATKMDNVFANGAVLFAAQNTKTDANAKQNIISTLTSATPGATIGNLLSSDPTEGLSQAALAYGLFTAYAYASGEQDKIAATEDPMGVLQKLNDDGFQQYLKGEGVWAGTNQASKDLDGYMSAMNMINKSADEDPDMALNVLTNGFADPALAGVIGQVLNQQ